MSSNSLEQDSIITVAIELSRSTWLIAARLPSMEKPRFHKIDAGDTAALKSHLSSLQDRVLTQSGAAAAISCFFEAGRDGFWLHRFLTASLPPMRADGVMR